MNPQADKKLEFSGKYDRKHAEEYCRKHQAGFWRRLSNWREQAMARKALQLAGNPASVLDLPCGTGRFWEVLAENKDRRIVGADRSRDMIEVGLAMRPQGVTRRLEIFECSAFSIPQPDNFVENLFCMRLLHHIGDRQDRLNILKEFARVASDSVIFSLWVDGNYRAWRRRGLEQRRRHKEYQNRFVVDRATIEAECADSRLGIVGHVDFLKYYAMWRIYVCKVLK